jgi:hypothetical protein
MSKLLCELEIDAACREFLAKRIVQLGGRIVQLGGRIVQLGGTRPPQPIVQILDAPPDPDEDPDWDELTARGETIIERTERVLARMGL